MGNSQAKIVIGLVGQKGSGKGTFSTLLQKLLPDKQIAKIKSSDILLQTLSLWSLTPTRENFQKLAVAMDQTFGLGTLTQAVEQQINTIQADIIIYDGVRWETDVEMIKKFPQSKLVYVTANPSLRYQRAKARNEKAGENEITFTQFMKEEQAHTEVFIPQIGAQADFTITNEGTLEDFKDQVKQVADQLF